MESKNIQLLILPGLGGDHRMAHSQRSIPYEVLSSDYIAFKHGETFAQYARRFGEHLVSEKRIDFDRPLWIGGYSFGSGIAQELARTMPVRGVILIGGLLSSDELRSIPRFFGRYIARRLPLWVYRAAELIQHPAMSIISGLPESEVSLMCRMYHDMPRGLYRAGYHTLAHWPGCEVDERSSTIPLLRVHGAFDHIITCPTPGQNIVIIPNTKHLVGQARPVPVNDAIEQFINRVMIEDK